MQHFCQHTHVLRFRPNRSCDILYNTEALCCPLVSGYSPCLAHTDENCVEKKINIHIKKQIKYNKVDQYLTVRTVSEYSLWW